MIDLGLLVLRLACGLGIAAHGTQKMFGWFEGGGPPGTRAMIAKLRLRPTSVWATVAPWAEVGGGLLLAVGLLTPLGALAIIAAMLVAILAAHAHQGFFAGRGGLELPLEGYLIPAVAILFAGPGRYSLDGLLGIALPEPGTSLLLTAVTIGTVALSLLGRRPEEAARRSTGQGAHAA